VSAPTPTPAAGEPTRERFASPALRLFAATRPAFILATVMPIFLGLGYSVYEGHAINWTTAVLTLLAGILLHAAINVLNDYYDSLNGTDDLNQERVFPFTGGSRFIQNAVLTGAQSFKLGGALLLAGSALGLWVFALSGPGLLVVGLIGVVLAITYTAPPCLVCRGLGDPVVAITLA
jgi:1,4-dihydroxy-2-naphthoate octaprenyltransferase